VVCRLQRPSEDLDVVRTSGRITRDADADLDAEFWRDLAREERRMVFRCHECNGISSHHPNCPSADDGQDDEEEEGSDDE